MWTAIAAALGAAKALFSWFGDLRRAKERAEYREAGRNEQKAATLEAREGQASDANAIDESVRRLSDADLDAELRGKPKPGS